MVPGHSILLACICLALAPAMALGQLDDLERVDQGIADRGSLSTSLRQIDSGLQQPNGFQQLYRVPGGSGDLMRVDGALYAVFPQSVYSSTEDGMVADIPPGTVFYIGGLPSDLTGASAPWSPHLPTGPAGATRQLDETGRVLPPPALEQVNRYATGTPIHRKASTARTVVTDPTYRARRVRSLMRQAVEASDSVQTTEVDVGVTESDDT